MVARLDTHEEAMRWALELAVRGLGMVEPNPAVGAVVVNADGEVIGEGWHERFGESHAEVHALEQAGADASGATLYVTLEPCNHHGKTPPCAQAVIDAGIRRVVIGTHDPAPHTAGAGVRALEAANIEVTIGVLEDDAKSLIAPFSKLIRLGLPFVHAKWAMTLDGKIASRTGQSQWISNELSRRTVHHLRSRMDGVMVGIGTAIADNPQLTARPPGPRSATRIVVDALGRLPLDSQLVQTAGEHPVLLATSERASAESIEQFRAAGVEVLVLPTTADSDGTSPKVSLPELFLELGRRKMTNVLVEGGGELLGQCFDDDLIDECHVFVAPKLLGGTDAITPLAGLGLETVSQTPQLEETVVRPLGSDVYIRGRVVR
ncbi:bifunctional diaminohydroxyphosphoribosylaminopyrimidine deaminase/5-amino-6-(5-phosphoribosylamino)uracil reductase RibD [Thalassoroseus pseudoceratinae]|uniref:bifunctional diaminohydroxyphosphoribosylaminopyrimidine deaminase/5-amino-6-(5-phosphoribosylamino)uracil reductase RibD n=1 Tax=Thalassoroseus pseudoceratinae TaxID=2713176 RepID=UPI0014223E46|nr:bifunctional diaminohydroxyphosphoribosylaminopyrimidine deaminase/5-amino-6-(5-phosphoribosylamino)uracil reductase RibD [Thalassoroseus pseudoceratinae]